MEELLRRLQALIAAHDGARPVAGLHQETQRPVGPYREMATGGLVLPGERPDRVYDVDFDATRDCQHPLFTHFLDGIQQSAQVAVIPLTTPRGFVEIPVFVGVRAAAILERSEGTFQVFDHLLEARLVVLAEHGRLLGVSERDPWIEFAHVQIPGHEYHPLAPAALPYLAEQIVRHVSSARAALESALVKRWHARRRATDWLYVDGGLANLDPSDMERVVGVVKRSLVVIRQIDYHTVYRLEAGQRSAVFLLPEPDERDGPAQERQRVRASWFLRLRERRSAEFGLVRVEASPDVTADRVRHLSRGVMAEGYPPAFGDARWDRMVNGIAQCEAYLRAIAPRVEFFQVLASRTDVPTITD